MTEIHLPYGKTILSATLPAPYTVHIIAPAEAAAAPDPAAVVRAALQSSAGGIDLSRFKGVKSAAIAVNDKTRPVPHEQLLPPLLEHLHNLDIPPQAITFIIATGTHPPMSPDEYPSILPSWIIERYPIICHDAEDQDTLAYLGNTSRGTPVYINRHYLAADLHLVVGNIEPHQFMGFSGGVKSVAIGLAGKTTINHNHAMMSDDEARLGHYEGNPARADVEEIGRLIRVDFALNALLNGQKKIVDAVAGDPVAVMQIGIPKVRSIFQVPVHFAFDLIIASPGGHPKDINVYQAQKALAHAALITKPGGTVILTAACPEGTGSKSYEHWMMREGMNSYEAVFQRFQQEGFRVGPHKAFQLARDAARVRVLLISEMADDFVKKLLLTPVSDLGSALDIALDGLTPEACIGVMPAANATIPLLL